MDKCLRYLKQWVLRCPPEKKEREMNKIAHVLLQKCFQVLKERYVFKEQSKIRLATIRAGQNTHSSPTGSTHVWLDSARFNFFTS